ncbi:MAG TPA: extracellular solute-binding protein [Piscinibacter sp.]|uniref:ABC transporter substrate-binding protein n=1 Tax=Piscinibacter sp. TaxID=1903157 RepID=UPI001B426A09|nr:extracellular solute-binding protein [Piscinibacter sp.]MBK7533312.1 extracellular solute-binding protein [Piscinibacter sp.]MBP6543432.1 extracellular solute-binding protein [Piscinibacter sp.]HOY36359.1 extracellular solute-binding protein [Piscinibacter sp.]HPG78753.1 extracellular solute-binding protein [Piscinibacter sp.]HPM67322.1 extracellular solute-binding protein [Piscinibacter sp.]
MKAFLKPVLGALALGLSAAAMAQNVTISVASFPDLDRGIKLAIPLYKKLHPNVEIKLTSLAYADHHTAMTTALATGANLPDVMAVDMGFIGKFAESGGMEDLAKAPYNALQYRDKVARFTYPLAMSGQGVMVGMPVDIGPGALFYRKDLLDKAGVSEADLTRSWESYVESGKKLKAATGAWLLASAVDIKDIYIRSDLKDGEGVYFDKSGKPTIDNARFRKAFELAKAARDAGIDGKIGAWSNEWSEGFKRDKIASQMMGAWLAGHLNNWLAPESKGKWRSAQLPGGAFGSWGGSFYGVPKKAQNKAAAWDFIKFLTTTKEMQIEAFRGFDAFPSLIEAQNDAFIDQPIEYLGGQKARQLWKVAAGKISAMDVDKFDPVAAEVVNAELENVLEKNKDIKAALADAQAAVAKRVRR